MQKKEIKSLTFFRFVAAFIVFLFHVPNFQTGVSNTFFPKGYIGVNFFFILSGFILAYNYHDRMLPTAAKIKEFYIARFARVYPVHFLTFWLTVPIELLVDDIGKVFNYVVIGVMNILLLQIYYPSERVNHSFNGPSWTIAIELVFYAIFPLVLLKTNRQRVIRQHPAIFIALLYLALVLTAWLATRYIPRPIGPWVAGTLPPLRCLEFIMGIFLFYLFDANREGLRYKSLAGVLEVAVIGLVIGTYALIPFLPKIYNDGIYFIPSVVLLIYVFAYEKGFLSGWFSHPKAVLLGEISFSFYMFHIVVITAMKLIPWLPQISPFWSVLMAFGVTLFLSFLCYFSYEMPLRRKIKQLLT